VSDSLSQPGVSVEKGSELILVTLRYSRYKQARVADATHRYSRRPLLFVEDLGIITPDVQSLRDRFQLPGMRVLQFAFDVIRTVRICLTASSPIPWRTLGRMTITNPGMVRRVAGLSDEESELGGGYRHRVGGWEADTNGRRNAPGRECIAAAG